MVTRNDAPAQASAADSDGSATADTADDSTEDEPVNIAAYIRVSTEKQVEMNRHESQIEAIDVWCESRYESRDDYNLVYFKDIGRSGQTDQRRAYGELMNNVHEFDIVVVRELSRFGRKLKTVIEDIEELNEKDVEFISLKEDLDTTSAQGKLFFQIIGAFNEFWANLNRERTLETMERKQEAGHHWGRPPKLSDEQISYLAKQKEQEQYSYKTLSALAEEKWEIDVTPATVRRNIIELFGDDSKVDEEVKEQKQEKYKKIAKGESEDDSEGFL